MVLPNHNTIGLLALLVAMWYAGASQSNAAAYLLAFVLLGVASVSALHTWLNIRGVRLRAEQIKTAFAGDPLSVHLIARTETRRGHPGLRVRSLQSKAMTTFEEITAHQARRAELSMPAGKRGRHEQIHVQLSTLFPLGFFTARRRITIHQPHIVYPRPAGILPLPRSALPAKYRRAGLRTVGDDFAGTRSYQRGESQRHIDWKAAARGQPLLVKQWAGEADQMLTLDWDDLEGMDVETRLSQLAQWILAAERSGASYGLRLPHITVNPLRGDAHFHECLRTLALFPADDASPAS
jgi:uncharacterized protein (DUF58 family)